MTFAFCCVFAYADGGSYSGYTPYSIFGVGNLSTGGTAYNKTMGGVGIASRNHRFINTLNPAAVTARDSLSFMSDFSLFQSNTIERQGDMKSVSNLFNVNNVIFSFPLFYSKYVDGAMMVGIKPYSSTGYSYGYYETNPGVLATVGNVAHAYSGIGSIYQAYGNIGFELFDRLSLGAEMIHYFGNIEKKYTETFSDKASLGIVDTYNMSLSANSVKFGAQYEQKIGDKWSIGAGAIYSLDAALDGYSERKITSGDATTYANTDTLSNLSNKIYLAGEMGVGVSINYLNKFRFEVDYLRSDWTNSGFAGLSGFSVNAAGGSPVFTSGVSESYRAGMEFIPNPNDTRYYHKIIAYRAGVYYNKEYYSVNGSPIYSRGITLGATLPVFRWYNGVTLGMELGQRGSLQNDLIRETYVGFSLGINLFDVWFQKSFYD